MNYWSVKHSPEMFDIKHIELAKRFFRRYPYTMDDLANVVLRMSDLEITEDDNYRIIQNFFDMCLALAVNPWNHYKRISIEIYKTHIKLKNIVEDEE
ncbi:hypothetical protein [Chryseobacterium luquanense]|uniref:Uncharacterized protein n=1 Tax=Chryseobacterium luquanense TaxID=2983766 RepID=A0ABT3Y4M0_9FLAO|nr:hypothetical protein [Chryseobacterium luquanense]MCX8533107.1 hypothetical protein [Chryseobacterium luquanense]